MPLDKQELSVGTKLTARYKKQAYTCEVVQAEEGKRYRLADGREFKSLSAAGVAITSGAINGWRFWSLTGDATTGESEGEGGTPATETQASPTATKGKVIKRVPNQRGVPDGHVRWFCSACMTGFLANAGQTPEVCPNGHRAESDENGQVVNSDLEALGEEDTPF